MVNPRLTNHDPSRIHVREYMERCEEETSSSPEEGGLLNSPP